MAPEAGRDEDRRDGGGYGGGSRRRPRGGRRRRRREGQPQPASERRPDQRGGETPQPAQERRREQRGGGQPRSAPERRREQRSGGQPQPASGRRPEQRGGDQPQPGPERRPEQRGGGQPQPASERRTEQRGGQPQPPSGRRPGQRARRRGGGADRRRGEPRPTSERRQEQRAPQPGAGTERAGGGGERRESAAGSRQPPGPPPPPLLDVRGLRTWFPVKTGPFNARRQMVRAVDGVSLQLQGGETLGLVGESGCGKTTLGRSILRLYQPQGGRVYLQPDPELLRVVAELEAQADTLRERAAGGTAGWRELRALRARERSLRAAADRRAAAADLLAMPRAALKQARRRLQMVFQDPSAALDPRMLVHDLIAEGPQEYGTHRGRRLAAHVGELLELVGLPRAAAQRYPHEFSGGQRQRIGIARALALAPSVVIADEPVAALDVSIQAQILNLLLELQEDLGLSYLFIAHDLAVVRYIAHRVAVMYLGKIVELGDAEEITEQPRHPYTISLMASVPVADPELPLAAGGAQGDVPSPVNPPSGCPFHPRCAYRIDACSRTMPELTTDRHGHALACHNPPPP